MTPEKRAEYADRVINGERAQEVAAEAGYSAKTVRRWVRERKESLGGEEQAVRACTEIPAAPRRGPDLYNCEHCCQSASVWWEITTRTDRRLVDSAGATLETDSKSLEVEVKRQCVLCGEVES